MWAFAAHGALHTLLLRVACVQSVAYLISRSCPCLFVPYGDSLGIKSACRQQCIVASVHMPRTDAIMIDYLLGGGRQSLAKPCSLKCTSISMYVTMDLSEMIYH